MGNAVACYGKRGYLSTRYDVNKILDQNKLAKEKFERLNENIKIYSHNCNKGSNRDCYELYRLLSLF